MKLSWRGASELSYKAHLVFGGRWWREPTPILAPTSPSSDVAPPPPYPRKASKGLSLPTTVTALMNFSSGGHFLSLCRWAMIEMQAQLSSPPPTFLATVYLQMCPEWWQCQCCKQECSAELSWLFYFSPLWQWCQCCREAGSVAGKSPQTTELSSLPSSPLHCPYTLEQWGVLEANIWSRFFDTIIIQTSRNTANLF